MQWWVSLSPFQQVMFVLATAATVVMIVFLVLMLIGADNDNFEADIEPDIDTINDEPLSSLGGLKLFTVRGVLTFISIGAWTAYGFGSLVHPLLASFFGIIAGLIASYLMALAFRASMKLESVGNLDYKNAIGKKGNVYIRIPAKRQGSGKVTITFQERYVEIDAITDDESDLLTGSIVEVVALENETTLIVTKEKKEYKGEK